MANYTVVLEGGSPWGFRLKGGRGTGVPLVISKVSVIHVLALNEYMYALQRSWILGSLRGKTLLALA